MSAKKSTAVAVKAVTAVAVVLAIVAVCGFVAYYTNGFTGDFTTFYVVCNGEKVMTSAGGYEISPTQPLQVDVVYMFDDFSAEEMGFSVKVVPNPYAESNFDFALDDNVYAFGAETDMTQGFDIVCKEKSFTLAPKGRMEDVLAAVYPTYTVSIDKNLIDYNDDLFSAVVTSYNGESSVRLNFRISDCAISGVSLDKEVIVF